MTPLRAGQSGSVGAGALLALLMLARAPAVEARPAKAPADAEAVKRATEHAVKGEAAFREGHYDQAMTEFGAGYAVVPRPGFILNMGHVQRQMGNLQKARGYYREYLEMDPGSKRRGEVEKLIADIDDRLSPDAKHPGGVAGTPPRSSPASSSPGASPPPVVLASAAEEQDDEVPAALNMSARDLAEQRDEHPGPFYKRWWFWGIVGGVLLGGALAVFLGTRSAGGDYTESGTWGALGK